MKAILASKRFNPGHISHIEANAKLLQDYGFNVQFLLNRKFFNFPGVRFANKNANKFYYFHLNPNDIFIAWFPSLSILIDIILVRFLSSATIVYIYHEPYTNFSSYRKAGFGIIKTLKVLAISFVNGLLAGFSHKIILPSTRAYEAVPTAIHKPLRYAKINLIFYDEVRPHQINQPRSFISYIGTIAEDHAFEEFVKFIDHSISNNLLLQYRFLIATRSALPKNLVDIIARGIESGRLVVKCGEPMANDQINEYYSKSHIVWNAYKRSMQSGVLPKSYMFGTPIIVSKNNENEYFQDGIHGAMISENYKFDEFQDAVNRIMTYWPILSNNCRQYYLQNFDYRALSGKFIDFVLGEK